MKYCKKLIVILSVLMFYIPKVKPQDTPADTPADGPADGAANGPADSPAAGGPADAPADGPADGPAQMPEEPPATTPVPFVRPDVAEYLNSRIRQVLRENPERDPSQLNLATIFNDKRARLEATLIRDPPQEDDDLKAEQALENFRNFMQQYNAIAGRLENAIDDLNAIEQDTKLPVSVRYEALMMLLELRDSSNIKDAERNLRAYEDFKQRLGEGSVPETPGVQPTPVVPPLSDEYRRYLEEILRILRKHVKGDDPKMQDLLHQLLQNPEKLKSLAAALKELSEEDYENEDYFWEWFSFW